MHGNKLYDFKSKESRPHEGLSKTPKHQFFRSSLKSRQELAFLRNHDRQHNPNLQPNNMNHQFKARQTLNRPQNFKYTSQTSKNQFRQPNNFFRTDQESKNKINQVFSHNKSAQKRNNNRGQYSPNHYSNKYNKHATENIRPQGSQYQRLHDKLNFLEDKISQMRVNLEKRKQQKKMYFQKQMKQRKEILDTDWKNVNSNPNMASNSQSHTKDPKVSQSLIKQMVTQVSYEKKLKPFSFDPYSPRHNIYYVSQVVKAYKQQNSLARQHLMNSIQLLKIMGRSRIPNHSPHSNKNVKLSKKPGHVDKKTVILDLDQTLIHCNQNVQIPSDIKLPIVFPTGQIIEAGINVRPYASQLLKNLAKNFQVIVFTASHSCYANVVIDYLDPENKFVAHRLFREHCFHSPQNVYVKDLRILNRDLSQVVLVDNAAYSYAYQVENGIPIIPYYQGKMDFQLKALQTYLQGLIFSKDVRQVNRNTFKLHRYVQFDSPESLVKELYHQDHR